MPANKSKAIGFVLLSAFGFAMMNLFVQLSGDLPFVQKAFFRNVVAMFAAMAALKREGVSFRWEKGNFPFLLLRAILGTVGIFCNFYALNHLMLADANILNKMSPFFAILFSLLLLKERATPFQYAAVLIAFGGSMLIIKPGFSADAFPAFIGLLGGAGAGAAYTMVRILSKRGEKGPRIIFFFSVFSTIVTLPLMLLNFQPMTWMQLLCLLGAGLAATLGQFGITLAYAYAPAKEISVFDYTQVLFSALLGLVLLGQVPDGWSILGYVVICGISVISFMHNRRLERQEQQSG